MSFLNPVSEPVKRFSSTDAGAPQINYNARVAGDVKTVLKACLVTGYGDKASAGWSVVNEVNHVAEFVSPSVAMSDYRLGIDDTSASSTTWYYQYQNTKREPINKNVQKSFDYADRANTQNSWQMLVTDRAIILVEIIISAYVTNKFARLTYWGSLKTTKNGAGETITFLSLGYSATPNKPPAQVILSTETNNRHLLINSSSLITPSAANMTAFGREFNIYNGTSDVSFSSAIYFFNSHDFLATHPALLLHTPKNLDASYGVFDTVIDGRPMLHVCLTQSEYRPDELKKQIRVVLIALDYWEF